MLIIKSIIISVCVVIGFSTENTSSINNPNPKDWSKITTTFNKDGIAVINLDGALHIARKFSTNISIEDIKMIFSCYNLKLDEFINADQLQRGLRKHLKKYIKTRSIVQFMKQVWIKTTSQGEVREFIRNNHMRHAFKIKNDRSTKFEFDPESPEYVNGIRVEITNDNTPVVNFQSAIWLARKFDTTVNEESMTKMFQYLEVAINEKLNMFQFHFGLAYLNICCKHIKVISKMMKEVWEKTTSNEIKEKLTDEDIKKIFKYKNKILNN
ncbi:uncharacterized protein LOC126901947 isoform X2 [Daktulosphaira vitifoliae]|uniref:uncharacterized protein LOC126901947 isoform X2 n=1 Tax=Daktulosphaira vitifoliae TaxID=58002 RepID=UPI0021AA42DD|nr:uncharacterized protein LOC126901947 isoform X2 [Daktulosphaira vitifoliae]